MRHALSITLEWCRHCGRPLTEIVDQGLHECDGSPDVVHVRYLQAKREAEVVFGPVVEAMVREL